MTGRPRPVYLDTVIIESHGTVDFLPEQLQSTCLPRVEVITCSEEIFKPATMLVRALIKSTHTVCPLQAFREISKADQLQDLNLVAVYGIDFFHYGKSVDSIPCAALAYDALGGGLPYPRMEKDTNVTWVFEPTSKFVDRLFDPGRKPIVVSLDVHVMITGRRLR